MRRMVSENQLKGLVSPENLLNNMEGSDSIVVDLNEDGDKVVIKADEDLVPTYYKHILKVTNLDGDIVGSFEVINNNAEEWHTHSNKLYVACVTTGIGNFRITYPFIKYNEGEYLAYIDDENSQEVNVEELFAEPLAVIE